MRSISAGAVCALVAALAIAGCTSGQKHVPTPSTQASDTSSPLAPDTSVPSSSDSPIDTSSLYQHMALGSPVPLKSGSDETDTYSIAVKSIKGAVRTHDNTTVYVGVVVEIDAITGSPDFSPVGLGFPDTDTTGDAAPDSQTVAITNDTCGNSPDLDNAIAALGGRDDGSGGYLLPDVTKPIIACTLVTFDDDGYTDLPSTIFYANTDSGSAVSSDYLGSWDVKVPAIKTLPKPPPPKLTLKVIGNGSRASDITWSVDTDISQATDERIPWSKKLDANSGFYQVSAQDQDGTSITCEILDTDGTVLDKNTSTGRYAIASCSTSY